MNCTHSVLVMASAALLLQTPIHAEEVSAPAATGDVATDSSKQPALSPQPSQGRSKELPKSESELRTLLNEANRRIEDLNRISQGWSNINDLLQQRLQSIASSPSGGVDKVESEVESAIKNKDIPGTKAALSRLYQQFLAPASSARFYLGGDNSMTLSPSGLFYARVDGDLGAIVQKYLQPAAEWHSEGGGGLEFPAYAESQRKFAFPTPAEIASLKQILSDERQKSMIGELTTRLNSAITEATAARDRAMKDLSDESAYRDQLNAALDKLRQDINGLAIELGLPLFCGTVLLLFAIPFIAQRIRRSSEEAAGEPRDFQFGTLVEISTVLLLTMSILILGLAGKLEGPVLGTLLGGISGYVLNRVREQRKSDVPQTP